MVNFHFKNNNSSRFLRLQIPLLAVLCFLPFGAISSLQAASITELTSRMLRPFADAASAQPAGSNGAFHINSQLHAINRSAIENGPILTLSYQRPDKLRAVVQWNQQTVVLCRNGNSFWAWPANTIRKYAEEAGVASMLQPQKPSSVRPLILPIASSQIDFLTFFLQIQEASRADIQDQNLRRAHVKLIPEFGQQVGLEDWEFDFWIQSDSAALRYIGLRGPGLNARFIINSVRFLPALEAKTWQPSPEMQSNILPLTQDQLEDLLKFILSSNS